MASKKGIILTGAILAAITIASFLVWIVPQNFETTFVVGDFENHLDGVKKIHLTISQGIDENFEKLLEGEINPGDYIQIAEISSSQVNSQIIQLVESKASEEWQESYINYIESLKQFNSQIRETIVVAEMIADGSSNEEIDNAIKKIEEFRQASESFIVLSDESRP